MEKASRKKERPRRSEWEGREEKEGKKKKKKMGDERGKRKDGAGAVKIACNVCRIGWRA